MSVDWVIVHTTNQIYKAEILKQLLEDEGIDSVIMNKIDSNYLFGEIEIYTRPDDVIRAKVLIEKFEP
jgi:hypothetical protein